MKALICLVASFLFSASASASLITIDTSLNSLNSPADNQGWWRSSGVNNNPTNDNYITGNYLADNYRSYFSFDLSGLVGTVTSATFEVRRYSQDGDVSLGLYDVSTAADQLALRDISRPDIYSDLGTGASYGSFFVLDGDTLDTLSFDLNLAAITDINSVIGTDFFSIGAAVLGQGGIFAASGQEPGNNGVGYIQRLVLDINAVPEPSTLVLFLLSISGLGFFRSKQVALAA